MNSIEIFEADLSAGDQALAIVDLLSGYALDPMGGGEPLSNFARENLIPRLKERQDALVILACVNHTPAGLVICFEGTLWWTRRSGATGLPQGCSKKLRKPQGKEGAAS